MNTAEKIKYFLENPEFYKRCLIIDDEWGTGKSTLIKNVLSGEAKAKDRSKIKINENNIKYYNIIDMCDIEINYNFSNEILLSSKAINTTTYIENESLRNINVKDVNNKNGIIQFLKQVWALNKNRKLMKCINYLKKSEEIHKIWGSPISFLARETLDYKFKKIDLTKNLIVIDELERCTDYKTIEWLLLKITKLQENRGIRVILIVNSEKFPDAIKELFKNWIEKISSLVIDIDNEMEFDKYKLYIDGIENKNRNLRILETYEEFIKLIDKKVLELLGTNKINIFMEKEIKNLKKFLYNRLSDYYIKNENQEDKIYTDMINIKDLLNLEHEYLIHYIKNILETYTDEKAELIKLRDECYDNIIFYDNQKNTNTKKKNAILSTLFKLFQDANIYKIIKLKDPVYRTDTFDKNSVLSYLDYIYSIPGLKLSKQEKIKINKILIKSFLFEKNNFKYLDTEELVTLWRSYCEFSFADNKNQLQSIIYNKSYLSLKEKEYINKKIKSSISNMYKIISNTKLDEKDFSLQTKKLHFHIKYNPFILDIIFKIECKGKDFNLLKSYMEGYFSRYTYKYETEIERQNLLEKKMRFSKKIKNKKIFIDF